MKRTLLDIFENSIQFVIQQDLEDPVLSIKDRMKRNKDFYFLVIADFILNASETYTKGGIKSFLVEHFDIQQKD